MSEYPERVPVDERPKATIENVPEEMIEKALGCLSYEECPHCQTQQWFRYVAGYNSSGECKSCGETLTLVG